MDDLVFESFNVQQQIHEELRFNLSKVQGSGFRAFGTFFFSEGSIQGSLRCGGRQTLKRAAGVYYTDL